MNIFSRFQQAKTFKCSCLDTSVKVSNRQELVPGWDQRALAQTTLGMVGAGGIVGEILEGIVKKGVGQVHVCDGDIVTPSNLNRQKFKKKSLRKNKAIQLCQIAREWGYLGTTLYAHPCDFQELRMEAINPTAMVCGVDNRRSDTRSAVCRFCHRHNIPCIFSSVSRDADKATVFVQIPGEACWACCFRPEREPLLQEDEQRECPGVAACIDILKVVSGFALFAIDTIIMSRRRDWNYRAVSLSTSEFGLGKMITKRDHCPVCGSTP